MACAHWENAYWADMAGAVSASEAAFQLLAGERNPCIAEKPTATFSISLPAIHGLGLQVHEECTHCLSVTAQVYTMWRLLG